jgi:threonylcarbamoyladenosine tRNA methylthiotransferase MtaB
MQGKISLEKKEERSKRLLALSKSKHLEFLELNTGQTANVLFEKTRIDGMINGYTGNYIRVEYPWQPKLAGQVKKVLLSGISSGGKMDIKLID